MNHPESCLFFSRTLQDMSKKRLDHIDGYIDGIPRDMTLIDRILMAKKNHQFHYIGEVVRVLTYK